MRTNAIELPNNFAHLFQPFIHEWELADSDAAERDLVTDGGLPALVINRLPNNQDVFVLKFQITLLQVLRIGYVDFQSNNLKEIFRRWNNREKDCDLRNSLCLALK